MFFANECLVGKPKPVWLVNFGKRYLSQNLCGGIA